MSTPSAFQPGWHRPMRHGQRNPAVQFPSVGEFIQVSVDVNADHFVNPDVAATDIPTLVSNSVSLYSSKAEGEDRQKNSPHVCIVLDVRRDMSEGTWRLSVFVGRSYGSSPEDRLAKHPGAHIPLRVPDGHIPLRVPDGHAQPPTPAAFGPPLDCGDYRSLVPTWVLTVEHELDMGRSGAVRCNWEFNPTEPRANFSAMKYRYFNPHVYIDSGELARLKDYLSKRATGLDSTRAVAGGGGYGGGLLESGAPTPGGLPGHAAGGGSAGIPPGVPQGRDSSHAGQPPNREHSKSALHSMRPCPWSVCC